MGADAGPPSGFDSNAEAKMLLCGAKMPIVEII
jgi:hypothetical protein